MKLFTNAIQTPTRKEEKREKYLEPEMEIVELETMVFTELISGGEEDITDLGGM